MASRRHSSELKTKTGLFLPQSFQIDFNSCCAIQSENSWKIVQKKGHPRNTRSFIKMTLGAKNSCPQTTRQVSSKSQLSRQSSREKFQKAKTQFIKQLKLWKPQTKDENPQTQTIKHTAQMKESNPVLDEKTKLLLFGIRTHQQDSLHSSRKIEGQQKIGELNENMTHRLSRSELKNVDRKGLVGHLNVIQQVQNHFQTSEGLLSRNQTFEVIHPRNEFDL